MRKSLGSVVVALMLVSSSVMATDKVTSSDFNPFEEIQKMQLEMDKIFDNFHKKMVKDDAFSKFTTSFPMSPAVDFKDKGDKYELKADIPGSDENEIHITTKDGMLKIEAKTSKSKEEKKKGYLKEERLVGSYMRIILISKPPALPEDSRSLTDTGVNVIF